MRAKEFVTEAAYKPGKRTAPSHEFERAHPGLVMPGEPGDVYWGRYYDFYRACCLAGMDIKDIENADELGFFGNLPTFSAYTEHDRLKLTAILKKLQLYPKDGVSKGSTEVDGTNTVSPVKGFKGY